MTLTWQNALYTKEMCYENFGGDWIHLFHQKKRKFNSEVIKITVKFQRRDIFVSVYCPNPPVPQTLTRKQTICLNLPRAIEHLTDVQAPSQRGTKKRTMQFASEYFQQHERTQALDTA